MLERWENIQRERGNKVGADTAKTLRLKFGDISLDAAKPSVSTGVEQPSSFVDVISYRRTRRVEQIDMTLTPRRIKILELIAQGLSYKEIADRLGVNESTVKKNSFYLGQLFNVTGAIRVTMEAIKEGKINLDETVSEIKKNIDTTIKLTLREQEVADKINNKRRISDIESELFVSRSTARTLINNIHAKQKRADNIKNVLNALTKREKEVLDVLLKGDDWDYGMHRNLATNLVVSENTVRGHLGRINRKLGTNTLQAALIYKQARDNAPR